MGITILLPLLILLICLQIDLKFKTVVFRWSRVRCIFSQWYEISATPCARLRGVYCRAVGRLRFVDREKAMPKKRLRKESNWLRRGGRQAAMMHTLTSAVLQMDRSTASPTSLVSTELDHCYPRTYR
ncbi:hypothetical protein KCU62_g367, partial [Aureobasidium sp. EXF-3399]